MSTKTIAYLGILFSALLVLALGGWIVKGAKVVIGQTRQPELRPRLA
jgi:hypothetical protein